MATDGQRIRAQGLKTGILEFGHHQGAIADHATYLKFWDLSSILRRPQAHIRTDNPLKIIYRPRPFQKVLTEGNRLSRTRVRREQRICFIVHDNKPTRSDIKIANISTFYRRSRHGLKTVMLELGHHQSEISDR
jgi:hypothetical protein